MYSAPVFSDSVSQTLLPAANATTDEELDAYIRNMATPFLHGVGSAAMSPFDATWGVVNPDFRVKGTSGLRVVDASVFVSVVVSFFFGQQALTAPPSNCCSRTHRVDIHKCQCMVSQNERAC